MRDAYTKGDGEANPRRQSCWLVGSVAQARQQRIVKEEKGTQAMACKSWRSTRRDDDFPVSPRPSIYTIQSSVIYELPSEIIESKCKQSHKPEKTYEGE